MAVIHKLMEWQGITQFCQQRIGGDHSQNVMCAGLSIIAIEAGTPMSWARYPKYIKCDQFVN